MAFQDIYNDHKQHLNLSEQAWMILEQDRAAFGEESLTGFLNYILLHYCKEADASLFRTRLRKAEQYRDALAELPKEHRTRAAEILADRDVAVIRAKIRAYPKGHSIKFRLNNELVSYLSSEPDNKADGRCENACCEDVYYKKPGLYLRAVLEEYARLPYLRRERIYFAEWFKDIEVCIDGHQVELQVASGREFLVRPYQIMTDAQSTYHYLVAWSDEAERCYAYRISNLKNVRQISRNGKLSAEKKQKIEQTLAEKDVPYIGDPVDEIRVQLTPFGQKKYRTILHQRPRYKAVENENVYVFDCTQRQAMVYFTRFGSDATILSPARLADDVRNFHYRALQNYPEPK